MSEPGTLQYAADAIQEVLGQSVGLVLGGNKVLLREVATGRFSFSTDLWTYFRENYEELKAAGAV